MIWLASPDATAPALPAAWLVDTGAQPADLAERSALRRGTARRILARHFQTPEERIGIGHDENGRPLLLTPAGTGLHLSLATRAGIVAVALAGRPVGVDVERVDTTAALPLAALHVLEREALAALPEQARAAAFARLWAAKEAYVKALGVGFVCPPESFAVSFDRPDGFNVADPARPAAMHGFSHVTKNGGHGTMAAALIVLD